MKQFLSTFPILALIAKLFSCVDQNVLSQGGVANGKSEQAAVSKVLSKYFSAHPDMPVIYGSPILVGDRYFVPADDPNKFDGVIRERGYYVTLDPEIIRWVDTSRHIRIMPKPSSF